MPRLQRSEAKTVPAETGRSGSACTREEVDLKHQQQKPQIWKICSHLERKEKRKEKREEKRREEKRSQSRLLDSFAAVFCFL